MNDHDFHQPLLRRVGLGLMLTLTLTVPVSAQYVWDSFAGQSGGSGSADATGSAARFQNPTGVAVDNSGTVYLADTSNNTIRKITTAGVVTTLAGRPGFSGSTDGPGATARFRNPSGLAVDSNGIVYVADTNNHTIRKITPDGVVSTLAGTPGSFDSFDGMGSEARFSFPGGVAVSTTGTVYVADTSNQLIRAITPAGFVSTFAGVSGLQGSTDGPVYEATFNNPNSLAVDGTGNLYIADTNNQTIRKITPTGSVTTLAGSTENPGSANGTGTAARFATPLGITVDSNGVVYVADTGNHTIRKITPAGAVTTFAGVAGSPGNVDSPVASLQRLNTPFAVAVNSSGTVYVADSVNHTLRQVTSAQTLTTFAGKGEAIGSTDDSGASARFNHPNSTAVDSSGNVYVADSDNHTIRKITPAGDVTTIAGSPRISGNTNGTGNQARFNFPYGIAVGPGSILYVADTNNHIIRKITPEGVVSTLAGGAGLSGTTNATGVSARFNFPNSVAVDASGNCYVADTSNFTIRKITAAGVVTTFAGSARNSGSTDGTATAARFNNPYGVAVDTTGKVYVADGSNHLIRVISSSGVVTTLAGTAETSGSSDGPGIDDGSDISALFNSPGSIAVDPGGSVFVADTRNHTIRKVTSLGVVTTLGGLAGVSGDAGGMGTLSRFSAPWGIAIGADSKLYVADYDNNRIVRGTGFPEINVEEPISINLVNGTAITDFGTVLIAATNIKTYTLRNTGDAPITAILITKNGPGATQFTLNTTLVGSSLAPGASTTFTVTFAPTTGSLDAVTAAIQITSSDEDENPFAIQLTGRVGFAEIAMEQPAATDLTDGTSTISYGAISIGTSGVKTFTIKNLGNSNLSGIAITKDGTANAQYVISTTGMATTLLPGTSTTFNVTFTPVGTALDARTARIRIANNDADENPFDIALTGLGSLPEISVEHPLATLLVDGTTSISYGGVPLGGFGVKTFTIRNVGTGNLTNLAVSKDGVAGAQYLVNTGMATSLAPGASTTFNVTFSPTGTTSSTRAATIRIASNDANENPFDIALTGLAFSTVADVDADGLNDWAEFQLAALGFNWQTSQPTLVGALGNGAVAAGLYSNTQLRALFPGEAILTPDPASQQFKLTLGVTKSTNLQTFSTLPMTTPSTSINGSGNLEFRFTSPEPNAFFRVQAQ